MFIAEIIPISSAILTESLSYFSAQKIEPGTLVDIPLRKKTIRGIVLHCSKAKNHKQSLRQQNYTIRNIQKVYPQSIFSQAYQETIQQLKDYYILPAGKLIFVTYPRYILNHAEDFLRDGGQAEASLPPLQKTKKILIQKPYQDRISIYQKLIHKTLQEKKSIHIICPTVLAVKELGRALKRNIPQDPVLFHGKVSNKALQERINEIRNKPSIILSTPLFIDIPSYQRTSIIIEEDSSSYYRRTTHPKIDLRIFIENYGKKNGFQLYFADSILRPERFTERKAQESAYLDMHVFSPERIELISALPSTPFKQSDQERIQELEKKRAEFSPFSQKFLESIERALPQGERFFFYTTRKSLAPSIVCRDCGKMVQDRENGAPYSLYVKNKQQKEFYYINRVNGKIIPAFDTCQFCGSWRLQTLGIGTERIQEELEKLFPDTTSIIIDSKHTKTETEIRKQLRSLEEQDEKKKCIIGTQQALPYIKDIDASFVVSIDGIFYQQSYHPEERLLILLKKIYDASQKTYLQTRQLSSQKREYFPLQEEKTLPEDRLQIKLTKRLQKLVKNLQFSKEFSKNFSSRSIEALAVWDVIRSGYYLPFIQSRKKNSKTIIKIIHHVHQNEKEALSSYYRKYLEPYTFSLKTKRSAKKDFLELLVIIHIEKNKWNTEKQDPYLLSFIPRNERNISIEIDPETLF